MSTRFPTQFNLFTNLNNRLGTIAVNGHREYTEDEGVRHLISASGSDWLAEEQLARIFGRNEIQQKLLGDFVAEVRGEESVVIGDASLTLAVKGGPTITRALKQYGSDVDPDPRYLRSIVQVSLIAWCTQSSLARSLLDALRHREEGQPSTDHLPITLAGINKFLEVVREQTASFDWRVKIEEVRTKLLKRFPKAIPHNSDDGTLALIILQGCLDLLTFVQQHPRTYYLKLVLQPHHNSGIAMLCIWAYDLLGLNVEVAHRNGVAIFLGLKEDMKQVKIWIGEEDSVTLHRREDDQEVFRVRSDRDTEIVSLPRSALGCGYQLMIMRGHEGPSGLKRIDVARAAMLKCDSMLSELGYLNDDRKERLKLAVDFLFPRSQAKKTKTRGNTTTEMDDSKSKPLDDVLADRFRNEDPSQLKATKTGEVCHDPAICIASYLLAFSCVADLSAAEELQIHLGHCCESLSPVRNVPLHAMRSLMQNSFGEHGENAKNRLLSFSWAGWTCWNTSMMLPDPTKVVQGQISVRRGVPVIAGAPRRFIVGDSPDEELTKPTMQEVSWHLPQLPTRLECCFPKITASLCQREQDEQHGISIATSIKNDDSPVHTRRTLVHDKSTFLYPWRLLDSLAHDHVMVSIACGHPELDLGKTIKLRPDCHMCDPFMRRPEPAMSFPNTVLVVASAGNRWARWLAIQNACIAYGRDNIGSGWWC